MSKTKYYFDSENLEFVPIKRTFIDRIYRLSLFLISSVIIGAFITVILLNTEFIDVNESLGRILSSDLRSKCNYPRENLSSMDGAVIFKTDIQSKETEIVGEIGRAHV